MSGSRSVDLIEGDLDTQNKLMYIHEKNGNYVDAEKCRVKIQQLKRDLESRTIYEMEHRHKREASELQRTNDEELIAFTDFWDKRANQISVDGNSYESELKLKHKQQHQNTKDELQKDLPMKVKETSELLNLRKMEEYMVKQKNFAEAHKVQQQIFSMEKIEKEFWIQKRNEKMETALNTLKGKQAIQMINLRKRVKTQLDQLNRQRKIEEQRLIQKHQNLQKDLHSQQQKQILNYKGQFRSKGGRDSPMRTKSSFTS